MMQPGEYRERIEDRLRPHQVRADQMHAYEAELREGIAELEIIVERRQTLEKHMDAEIENLLGCALLEESRQARHYFRIHFPFLEKMAASNLFDLVSSPNIFGRTGRWLDEAQYFEDCIESFNWVDTMWYYMHYRISPDELASMLIEDWADICDACTIGTIRSWLDCANCQSRIGWGDLINYDHGLSGLFSFHA